MKKRKPKFPQSPPRYTRRWPWSLLFIFVAFLAFNLFFQWVPWPWTPEPPSEPPVNIVRRPLPHKEVIDFNKIKAQSDPVLTDMIDVRKKDFGLRDSVDMVARPEESIKVGEETVTLAQILAQIKGADGPVTAAQVDRTGRPVGREMRVEDLTEDVVLKPTEAGQPAQTDPEIQKAIEFYGIYVVRSGDNLWNIHFQILREYLRHRGIEVEEHADSRKVEGGSSGVARILKFAEKMVHIFNVKTKSLDYNLNTLEPDEKVIIFNLTRLEKILGSVTKDNIDTIIFDGKSLYLPGEEPDQTADTG